ncbi:DNA-binding protein escarola-like [Trifolium pratense]|uniref:DNA-binding protein escarola-like n=2 Tax=Trifolium pratense TaxID=57577 RepID=A0A2K3NMP9_TRIPR|nr:DNA-binding protein escarola-like [Trifolium pratense]CAJ2660161.1 unnamed protein product [Trifolium pratense]
MNYISSVIALRPQGSPIDSKNNVKTVAIETHDNPNELYPHLIEIANGANVLKSVIDYAHQQGRGICLLGGSGFVTQVTLHLSISKIGTLSGIFQILRIFGTIPPPQIQGSLGELTVCLLDAKGQVVMGNIIPPLVAFGPVKLTTTSFANITCESLP